MLDRPRPETVLVTDLHQEHDCVEFKVILTDVYIDARLLVYFPTAMRAAFLRSEVVHICCSTLTACTLVGCHHSSGHDMYSLYLFKKTLCMLCIFMLQKPVFVHMLFYMCHVWNYTCLRAFPSIV